LEDFDARFFGISPKEAEQMDPQQRLALEVAWEALEHAGIPQNSLSGSDTAVFMGVNSDDYGKLLLEDLPNVEPWMGIGTAYCGVANRISYHLDLMGPSTAVDAACASSLVAIHLGRQAILSGESKLAIVGGVNAIVGPSLTSVLHKAGALSADGRCRSFDDAACGYGRGEGAAVIILKNMAEAVKDNDHILAVLKGSAIAQDGHTNGIMAPNRKAQEMAAKKALEVARVEPSTVDYVEAHATSTPVGDPTEVSAISAIYGEARDPDKPCFIGSVKPNVGHLEAGAGAVGFIKAVMSVQKGILPPQTNLQTLSTKIDWNRRTRVVQEIEDWPKSEYPRRAGVCSYGYGGTVSHGIVEQYIHKHPPIEPRDEWPKKARIILLSAPHRRSLPSQAATQADWISTVGMQYDLAGVATTLGTRRNHHKYRAAFVVESHADAAEKLKSYGNQSTVKWVTSGGFPGSDDRPVTWVFSGHGAQWTDMAHDLLQYSVFRDIIGSVDTIVQEEMGFSAIQAMKTGNLGGSDQVQVLTYLMQIGLSEVLRSQGVGCNAVIGHSVGEIAASVAAGCITPREGAVIVTRRAKLYRRFMGSGGMLLVCLPFEKVAKAINTSETSKLVTAINSSPSSCVVSGPTEEIKIFSATLKDKGVKAFRVDTDIAFHHPMLCELLEPLAESLNGCISPSMPKVAIYSTSASDPRSLSNRGVHYWLENMVKPVQLTSAVAAAAKDGLKLYLEVSSHRIVSHSIEETLLDLGVGDFTVTNTMMRETPAERTILYSMAQLHCQGARIDWKRHMRGSWAANVPTTTWNHKPVCRKIQARSETPNRMHDIDKHNLLGHRISVAGEDITIYETRLDEQTKPFPGRHPVHGCEIVPAAVLVNTFLHGTGARVLYNLCLRVPVSITEPREVQLVVQSNEARICSRLVEDNKTRADRGWLTHTTSSWAADQDEQPITREVDIEAAKSRINKQLEENFSIKYLASVGVPAMGFPWAVTEHHGDPDEMVALVDTSPNSDNRETSWDIHSWAPILDSATSVASTLFFEEPRLRMPAHVKEVRILVQQPPPKIAYLYVKKATGSDYTAHISVCNENGTVLVQVNSMRFSELEETSENRRSVEGLVHQLAWPPAIYSESPLSISHIILVSRDKKLGNSYAASIKCATQTVTILTNPGGLVDLARSGDALNQKDTIIAYIPGGVSSPDCISSASQEFAFDLLDIVKFISTSVLPAKVFVLTHSVMMSRSATSLAQAPLHGLSRIIASELHDNWGALIDLEAPVFPLAVMKYVQKCDIIRIADGIPRIACLRPLPRSKALPSLEHHSLLPHPLGTYLITGGLGDLGLETADFLVEKGARRIILVSRRSLPHRRVWTSIGRSSSPFAPTIQKIISMESRGATIQTISLDIASHNAVSQLSSRIDALCLPPIRGVIHAAGVLHNEPVLSTTPDSFERVIAPKIAGSLTLNTLFPPKTLDFMVLFSSCGQLFGFPGQASYASGNAFLDALATYRRSHGDNTVAMQWTSWREVGMAAGSDFVRAELATKGITDISRDEAFQAWMHISKFGLNHAVILRSRALEAHEPLPSPLLTDIAVRKIPPILTPPPSPPLAASRNLLTPPPTPKDRFDCLSQRVRECVADVLQMESGEVTTQEPLRNMGMDSVMTVHLRAHLQKSFGILVPPNLIWSHPTVDHIAKWLIEEMDDKELRACRYI
jgi:6-methylsalicylic acid synthase